MPYAVEPTVWCGRCAECLAGHTQRCVGEHRNLGIFCDGGLSDRIRFEATSAADTPGEAYDLVTMFDCLHDMGDPVGAAKQVRRLIADDGTWLVVEPRAGDRVEDNLNPVGRAYYGFSTLLCTPSSLAQDVGLALGTQAGPARIRDVTTSAGFTRFRVAAETPFNKVLEVRK